MAKKIALPAYDNMLLGLGSMSIDELTRLINCAKVALRQKQPRALRKIKTVKAEEKASA